MNVRTEQTKTRLLVSTGEMRDGPPDTNIETMCVLAPSMLDSDSNPPGPIVRHTHAGTQKTVKFSIFNRCHLQVWFLKARVRNEKDRDHGVCKNVSLVTSFANDTTVAQSNDDGNARRNHDDEGTPRWLIEPELAKGATSRRVP